MPRPRLSPRRPSAWAAPFAVLFLLFAAPPVARAVPVAGLTATNKIILFDSDAPGTLFAQTFVIGLQPGERVVGIDYRTSTAQLYAVGSSSRLYVVDPVTGLARQVGSAPFSPPLEGVAPGVEFGVDFDPASDKLRVVSEAGQNLLLDPDTGAAVANDPALVYAGGEQDAGQTPSVTAIAYTNNFRGASARTLYGLDWRRNTLVRIGQPSTGVAEPPTGQTFTVGPLSTGFGVTELAGFDVAAADATAYAAMRSTDALAESIFYTVNLDTGAASRVGPVGGGEFVRDVTALSRPYDLFAVTASHKLLRFNSARPGAIISSANIPALQSSSERIVGTDCCPRGHEVLTLLTDASRFYNYNVATGNLVFVGEILTANGRLSGNDFGFTFSPGGSRVVSDTGQNLVTNASTGVGGSPRPPLFYAPGDPHAGTAPRVVGAAFEQKGAGSRMFDIDFNLDTLARQVVPPVEFSPPDTGELFTVGPLGFDTTAAVGFDTAPGQFVVAVNPDVLRDDGAFASLTAPGATTSGLFSVSLRTGRAMPLGTVGGGEVLGGLTVATHVGLFRFSPGSYFVGEDDGSVTLTVTRSGDTGVEASVDYETFPSNVGATQVQDYTFASGTLRFAPGEASKTFNILITNDAHQDPGPNPFGESFTVFLRNPTAGFAIDPEIVSFAGTPGTASVLIEDDDSPPPGRQQSARAAAAVNPIDDTEFFVRQHYRDFLGRDPDAGGLAFWTGEIEGCGSDQQCRDVKRENVSAAFFLSIEFQNTGYLVHRLYRAAFGRAPTYLEFMRGTREAAGGVVVGRPGWEEQLALAKQAYAARFAARADFKQVYDPKTDAEYVDTLFARAGVAPDAAERQALVAGLVNRTETRATVLLKVAENEAFARKEFSPAFVLAEYFGYLRRDADAGGFNFWLKKLEDNGGNFIRAEMVKAFITSIEYRERFAP